MCFPQLGTKIVIRKFQKYQKVFKNALAMPDGLVDAAQFGRQLRCFDPLLFADAVLNRICKMVVRQVGFTESLANARRSTGAVLDWL